VYRENVGSTITEKKDKKMCPSVIEKFLTKKSIYDGYSIYRTSNWKEASRVYDIVLPQKKSI